MGRYTYSVAIAALLFTLSGRSAFSFRNYTNETFDILVKVQIVNEEREERTGVLGEILQQTQRERKRERERERELSLIHI